ncbi:MAG TPA: hypothetical protein VFC63_29270 [Blastocatellia bacterium]|nr:hypothetical protein [Blastocatellia bacterium]
MEVMPIISRTSDETKEKALFLCSIGCRVFKDSNDVHYVVANSLFEMLPVTSSNLVFETVAIPECWTEVKVVKG